MFLDCFVYIAAKIQLVDMGNCYGACAGRLPARVKRLLEKESIALIDEGVTGTSSMYGQGCSHKTCIMASVVVTKERFAIFTFGSKPIVNISVNDERLNIVESSVTGIDRDHLIIKFDGSKFSKDESFAAPAAQFGKAMQVEVSLHTSKAREFYHLHQLAKGSMRDPAKFGRSQLICVKNGKCLSNSCYCSNGFTRARRDYK